MKIYLDSVGCRLNQSEIELYARQFRAAGHSLVASPEDADMVVINTCAVTAAADADSRQKIRQSIRAGACEVVVTGCWATLNPEDALAISGVNRIVLNQAKENLVPEFLEVDPQTFDFELIQRQLIPGKRFRTRAFIKCQDGCDNRCAFCITTIARGNGRSRSIADILSDVTAAAHFDNSVNGDPTAAQEIVLTGVHLGSWGQDISPALTLKDLVQAILDNTDVPRVRLSSLEPWDIGIVFFHLWDNPRLCRHLHLPLQSGCAATLRRMVRKTSPQEYADLVAAARDAIPGVAITTDIIAGFPGETEEEFVQSLKFVESMDFAGGHVFTYSERPGTTAARMPDQIPVETRRQRNAQMRAVFTESKRTYQAKFLGRVLPVLWESATAHGPEGWRVSGLTDNYLRVNARAPQRLWNTITPVKLVEVLDGKIFGELV